MLHLAPIFANVNNIFWEEAGIFFLGGGKASTPSNTLDRTLPKAASWLLLHVRSEKRCITGGFTLWDENVLKFKLNTFSCTRNQCLEHQEKEIERFS